MIRDDVSDDLHLFETPDEAFHYLRHVGTLEDGEIDIAEAALALSLVFLPGLHIDRYRQHIRKVTDHVIEDFSARRRQEEDSLSLRMQVLRKVMFEAHGYTGSLEEGETLDNNRLIRVIERRRGAPAALALLYIALAAGAGWDASGVDFPGRFLVRLDVEGARAIVNPFSGGVELQAPDLRRLLKETLGAGAELSHTYYQPLSRRAVLTKLQNTLKKKLIDLEEYAEAVQVVETIEAFAPDEYRILFDKGVLYAKLGQKRQAVDALRLYADRAPDPSDRQQARLLILQIETTR